MAIIFDFTPSGADGTAVAGATATGGTIGAAPVAAGVTTGTLKFDASYPLQPTSGWRYVGSSYGGILASWTAAANVGISWEQEIPALPSDPAVFAYLAVWKGGGNVIGTLSVTSTGVLRLQDKFTVKKSSSAALLSVGDRVRFCVSANPGSATGHRVQVWIGGNRYGTTPDYDSGTTTATGSVATSVDTLIVGEAPSGTLPYNIRGGRIRVSNDGTDPTSGYAGAPAAPTVTGTPSNGQVALSWTAAVSGQTAVAVYRRTAAGTDWGLVTTLGATATGYTDTTVVNGTTYQYAIRFANSAGYGTGAFVTATPAATSSSTVQLISDVLTASASAVGATGTTLASVTAKATADPASYIVLTSSGHYVGLFSPPTTPLPAGQVGKLTYVLGAGQSRQVQISLKLASGTVLVVDDPAQAPGTYTVDLPASAIDAITSATAGTIQFDMLDLGAPVAGAP